MKQKVTISLFALVMLMTGAVDGITNLPSIAIFGQQLVFFFIAGGLLFLMPTGLISAELCAQLQNEGGVYAWSKSAFGSHVGLLAIWLQWVNTMVWFPTCLATLAGTLAYLFDPALLHHPTFLVTFSLTTFWIMTILNMRGIKESARIASVATMLGMVIPMVLIIVLSVLWVATGKPTAVHLTKAALLPALSHKTTWTSLTAVITAFLGMELATVHIRKIHNAHSLFPKALVCAILLIILTMGFGSLGVAMVVPHHEIALVAGTMQAFDRLFDGFHVHWLEHVLGVMLIFGSLATMVNWLISPANGLAQAAKDGYLPKALAKENKHGVPSRLLFVQGIVVSLVASVFFLMPSINGSYWLLIDLSTELYLLMYVLMFLAAIKLFFSFKHILFIPFGKAGYILMTLLGLVGCCIAITIGFFPPTGIDVGSASHYLTLFGGGLIMMISPVVLLIAYKMLFHTETV